MSQPGQPTPGWAGGLPVLPRRRTSVLAVLTMVVLGLIALIIFALILVSGGPGPALVATAVAAVSFPLLVALCFWLDRYEPEPGRYRVAALLWGGTGAVLIGVFGSRLLSGIDASDEVASVAWAPLTEELGKGLFLVLLVLFRRRQLHGVIDGIVYAALVGIGFAFVEDVLYYLLALSSGGYPALTVLFVLRGVIGPFAHPLFTSAFGVGVGLAVTTRSPAVRALAPLLGYLVAVLLHATWNGSVTFAGVGGFFAAYVLVIVPALAVVVALGFWARARESRAITEGLQRCVQRGWVHPAEIRWVARMSDRMLARRHARRVGGRPAARVTGAFQLALTEMAFLDQQVVQGPAPPDAGSRMGEILGRAAYLRPYVLWPPVPPLGPGGAPGRPPAGPVLR